MWFVLLIHPNIMKLTHKGSASVSVIVKCLILLKIYGNKETKANKLRGLSPRTNYTDRETTACQRSDCQLLRIEGATWSA
jgi:hypothetical protein